MRYICGVRRPIAASFGLALCALVACKKTVEGPIPLCASEVEGGEAEAQADDDDETGASDAVEDSFDEPEGDERE